MPNELQIEKEDIWFFLKKYNQHILYFLLAFIIWLGAFIRTRNLKLLQGKYLLGVDPYLFLRYASYIVEHGKLMTTDMMRYFPLGFNPKGERLLLAYILAYFYKFINLFAPSLKFIQFDIIYPVIFFCASMILFYLLVKRLFNYKVAILATAFLVVIPTFLHRTMAGFSDKEPIGIFLMFLIFYFYVLAFQSKQFKFSILFGSLAGIFTSLLGVIWGIYELILLIIPSFVLIEFFLNKIKKRDLYTYLCWFITWLIFFKVLKSTSWISLIISPIGSIPFFTFLLILINHIIIEKNLFKIKEKIKNKLPTTFFSLIIVIIIIFILTSLLFGPSFLFSRIGSLTDTVIHPMGTSRFVSTVAEAKQPYFTDWKSHFHWFFWMFFLGSILLFYNLVKPLKKYKYFLTIIFILFLSAFIFNRYSSKSILNGENFISIFLYLGSSIIFVLLIIIFYLYTYYKDKETHKKIINLNKSFVFTLVWFLLMVVAVRGGHRIFFIFSPITAILAAYLIIQIFNYSFKTKDNLKQIICLIFIAFIIIVPVKGSFIDFTKTSYNQAKYLGPYFNPQWQETTDWIKENTPKDSVFAHWWDYGYWVQTMGERATISDGGNAMQYLNHYVGRHVLLAYTPEEALEYLKTHKVNYLLITPVEIGKYVAYSNIGSDKNYDKFTYIPVFMANPQEIQETRTETIHIFKGNFDLDEDFIYKGNLYSKDSTGIAGFIVPVEQINNTFSINQPTAILIYNNKRIDIPLECVFFNGVKYKKEYNYEQKGLGGCLMLMPTIKSDNQVSSFEEAFYISKKARKTLFTNMYLFDKEWEGFKKVYDDSNKESFKYYTYYSYYGLPYGGPIKIWKVTYPPGTKTNPNYLNMSYVPDDLR